MITRLETNKPNNKFDYLLIFVFLLFIFGVWGGALQPIRVFVILCSPFTIHFFLKNRKEIRRYQFEIFIFSFWLIYALITLFWVIDPVAGFKEFFYLLINFICILTILFLSKKANNSTLSIIKGWTFLFIISLPIAFYEIIFDVHLSFSITESNNVIGGLGTIRKFASVAFGNFNAYNLTIAYCLPFIFSLLFIYNKKIQSILIWLVIISAFFILITNASRGAIICALISLISFVFNLKNNNISKTGITLFSIIIFISLFYFFNEIFFFISYRMSGQGVEDNVRSDIITKGLKLFENSYFFGVGSGNFQTAMAKNYTLDIYAAHNFFLEVLVSYGFVIFILFLSLFFRIAYLARKNSTNYIRYIVFTSLITLPFAFIIDSGYILSISGWLLIASLFAIATKTKQST